MLIECCLVLAMVLHARFTSLDFGFIFTGCRESAITKMDDTITRTLTDGDVFLTWA